MVLQNQTVYISAVYTVVLSCSTTDVTVDYSIAKQYNRDYCSLLYYCHCYQTLYTIDTNLFKQYCQYPCQTYTYPLLYILFAAEENEGRLVAKMTDSGGTLSKLLRVAFRVRIMQITCNKGYKYSQTVNYRASTTAGFRIRDHPPVCYTDFCMGPGAIFFPVLFYCSFYTNQLFPLQKIYK